MTLLLIEGFDHMSLEKVQQKRWSEGTNSIGDGRRPGANSHSALVLTNHTLRKSILQAGESPIDGYNYLIAGFAINWRGESGSVFEFTYIDAPDTRTLCSICVSDDGFLYIVDTDGTTVAIGTTPLATRNWHYVEAKLFTGYDPLLPYDGTGTCEVHLDGAAEISEVSGGFQGDPLPGASHGPGYVNRITLTAHGLFIIGSNYFDDVYVQGDRAPGTLDYYGDVCVETLWPAVDGTHTDWTPDTGSDHFARVNENQADGDASVVTTTSAGDKDTYLTPGLEVVLGSVFGAQLNVYARKNDAALREIAPMIRQAGVDYDGPTTALQMSYAFHSWLLEDDPSGTGWTISTVDADEYGVDLIT